MIYLFEPGHVTRNMCNPVRIAVSGIARINQQRFAQWGHNQRSRTTLDVDEINVQWFRFGIIYARAAKEHDQKQK
jgi:hypothetical protein